MWTAIGGFSLLPLVAVLHDNPTEWLADVRTRYFLGLAGAAIVGVRLGWGPLVPCAILGSIAAKFFTDPIASSYHEAVFKDIGMPLIGATIGVLLGLALDRNLSARRCR